MRRIADDGPEFVCERGLDLDCFGERAAKDVGGFFDQISRPDQYAFFVNPFYEGEKLSDQPSCPLRANSQGFKPATVLGVCLFVLEHLHGQKHRR